MRQLTKSLFHHHCFSSLFIGSNTIIPKINQFKTNNKQFSTNLWSAFEKEEQLEEYLYKNKNFDGLVELFDLGVLNFAQSRFSKNDREIVKRMLETEWLIDYLPVQFRDKETLLEWPWISINFGIIPENLRHDKDILLRVLQGYTYDLSILEPYVKEKKDDEEFMTKAIEFQGKLIQYASEKLRNKRSLVLKAVSQSPQALELVGEKFRGDKAIVLKAVKREGSLLRFASQELKSDLQVVLTAVKSDPYSLSFASEELKNDANIAMTAIKTGKAKGLRSRGMGNSYYILEIVGNNLKRDKSFMIRALAIEPKFSSNSDCEEILKDPEVALSLKVPLPNGDNLEHHMKDNKFARKYFKKLLSFRFQKDLVNIIYKQFKPLEGICLLLQDKKELVRIAMEKVDENRELALLYVGYSKKIPEKYLSDQEFILELFKGYSFHSFEQDIDADLAQDRKFIKRALELRYQFKTYPFLETICKDSELAIALNPYTCLPPEVSHKIPRQLALEIVSEQGMFLKNLNPLLQQDRELVYRAVLNDPSAIQYAHESLQKDKTLALKAIEQGLGFSYLHKDIQYDSDILNKYFKTRNISCQIIENSKDLKIK